VYRFDKSAHVRRTVLVLAGMGVLFAPIPLCAAAPRGKPPPVDDESDLAGVGQNEILVTANRTRSVTTDVPPEVSLNSTVIQALGAADLSEVFRELAPEIGIVNPTGDQRGGTAVVLVNGQRIAGFSSVKDFPPEAVHRIEIFPEKVALQYGYGSDQRVVNIVLRENYHALTLLARYTLAPDNLRGVYRAKADLIHIGETSHWNIALDYSHTDPIFAGTTVVDPTLAFPANATPPNHTLAAQDDHLTVSGTANRRFGTTTAELTGSLDLDGAQSRPGLSGTDAMILTQEGLASHIDGPYARYDETAHARTNLTLNGKIDGWRWSMIARADEDTRITRTESAFGPGGRDFISLPPPTLLGDHCSVLGDRGCVSTELHRVSTDSYLNGSLLTLPNGPVTLALRTGFAFSGIRGESLLRPSTIDRDEGSAQGNIDVPITARDFFLGKLSVGVDGEAREVTNFGTLGTFGSSLTWAPVRGVNLLASFSHSEQAPTLAQLGQATLGTPDLREYDFVTGTTTIVNRIEGGNTALTGETARIARVRLQVSPLANADLVLSGEYTLGRTRNPIVSITAATAATTAAFPTRFARENGYLTVLDTSPVNGVSRDSQQVRWGLTYSGAFGGVWAAKPGMPADRRNQFQIALYDTWHLQDDLLLRQGQRSLDLLGGDLIRDDGGTPAHRVELQTSVSLRTWSLDVSGNWQTPTTVKAGDSSSQQLTFRQGVTLNLRLGLNLAYQHWLTRRLPFLKGTLNLSADNLLGAHLTVHDQNGIVPTAYSESYLNPIGRTFRITLRKRFR
jgi:hypothetical protein